MVKPTQPSQPVTDPAVIEAIKLADLAGRPIADTEVAALAAGVLSPSDLVAQMVDEEAAAQKAAGKDANCEQQQQQQHQNEQLAESFAGNGKVESGDEGSSDEDEQQQEKAPAETVGAEGMAVSADEEEEGEEEEEEEEEREKGGGERSSGPANAGGGQEGEGGMGEALEADGGGAAAEGETYKVEIADGPCSGRGKEEIGSKEEEEEEEDSSAESSSDSSSDDDAPEPNRRKNKRTAPRSGPLSGWPTGDLSDGEDGDFADSGVPMTKNEEVEPILPLGEVSMDGAEVKEVGSILSLVEADGTIVVQGRSPPLDEGCVLSSCVVVRQGDGTLAATGPKEPLGRIHEIFGPCVLPHYTVRVEGAATQHQLITRCQAARANLAQAEKERGAEKLAGAEEIAKEVEAKRILEPAAATSAVEEEGRKTEVLEQAEEEVKAAAAAAAAEPLTPAESFEEKNRSNARECNSNKVEKLEALREVVRQAEEAMGVRKEHPFSRWKVGAAVYALENAKYLPKESIIRGKGSDASNWHDEEADEEEFSDDEQEQLAKKTGKRNKRRGELAAQGLPSEEIDSVMTERENARHQRKAKAQAQAQAGPAAGRGGRGGRRGGRRDGGGRGGGRGGRGGHNRGDVDGQYGPAGGGGVFHGGPRPNGAFSSGRGGGGGIPATQQQQQQQAAGFAQGMAGGGFAPRPAMVPPGPAGFPAGYGGLSPPGPFQGHGFPPQQQQIPNPSQYVQHQLHPQFQQARPPPFQHAPQPQFQQHQQPLYGPVPVSVPPQGARPSMAAAQQQPQLQGGGGLYISGGDEGVPGRGIPLPPPGSNGPSFPPR